MSSDVHASAGGTRDVNCTCNVLHVPRSSQFNTASVLNQIVEAQGLLATGATIPADINQPYGQQGGASWIGDDGSDVTSCAWAKDLDGVVGTLSFQAKPRPGGTQYLQTILPGDLLIVFMDDTGDYDRTNRFSGTLITVAVVDRVSQSTRVQNMATTNDVSVSARDLTVVFSESSTVLDAAFAQLDNAMYTGEFINKLFNDKKQNALSPLENVLILLLLLYDSEQTGSKFADLQWKLTASSDGASLTQLISLLDVTSFVQNPLPFYALAEPPGIIQAGNVWSLLDSYANTLVNEFFVDVRDINVQERQFIAYQSARAIGTNFGVSPPDVDSQQATVDKVQESALFRMPGTTAVQDGTSVVALVLRQRPYDDDAFSQLPFTAVDSTEIETFEPARSSHDVFNWFRVRFPSLDVKLQEFVAGGIQIVMQSIAKFGFRRMEGETRYMFADAKTSVVFSQGNTKTDFSDVIIKYLNLLTSWFAQNEYWYAGPMTMRFRPSIRIGTRIRFSRGDELYDYYVQGVQHSFSKDPGASRTMLTLTRGRCVSEATVPAAVISSIQHDGVSTIVSGSGDSSGDPAAANSADADPSNLAPPALDLGSGTGFGP